MAKAWHLMRRPKGMPVSEDFAFKDYELPELGDGMVRVANRWLSIDPYMRGRMNDVKSYVPPFQIDQPEKRLVHQGGGRDAALGTLSGQAAVCDAVQLALDQRNQRVQGRLVAPSPRPEKNRDVLRVR